MSSSFSQAFPPAPTSTEQNVGNLQGKVFIVTGAASGVGYELAKLLYRRNAIVYIAARSLEKVDRAIKDIKAMTPSSKGRLVPMIPDLSNFPTIKEAANEFLQKEDRLDVLVHNAGLMTPPASSKGEQGQDLEMATNCLGPFLLDQLLEPMLTRTASVEPTPDRVRVVWVSSMITASVPDGGVQFDKRGSPKVLKNAMQNYMQTKAGNVFLASEAAKRMHKEGIVSMSVNPGLMKTELQRHAPKYKASSWCVLLHLTLRQAFHYFSNLIVHMRLGILFKPPVYGAYAELFAALSPEVTSKRNGGFIVPWGRFGDIPDHIEKGLKPQAEGGTGAAERFWNWCERNRRMSVNFGQEPLRCIRCFYFSLKASGLMQGANC